MSQVIIGEFLVYVCFWKMWTGLKVLRTSSRPTATEYYKIAGYFQVIFIPIFPDLQSSGPMALNSFPCFNTPKIQFMNWFRCLGLGKARSGSP